MILFFAYVQCDYFNSVLRMDAAVGHLLDRLEQSKFSDNTVVMFTADHGAAFPRSKLSLYENGIATPLIISLPKKFVILLLFFKFNNYFFFCSTCRQFPSRLEHKVDLNLISNIDIPATILHLANIPQHLHIDSEARSLLPFLLESSSSSQLLWQPFRVKHKRHVLITEFISHSLGCCDPLMSIRDSKVFIFFLNFFKYF